jgi:2-polyprenyl-3-methyl-5-hydroxy-6-metoxy-1,4-benzoquinol methylase
MMNKSDLITKIYKLGPWFQNICLQDEIETAPDHPLKGLYSDIWQVMQDFLPEDLSAMKVLDINCNAGYFSLELAKRGAEVSAIEYDAHYLDQAAWLTNFFNLKSRINLYQMQIYDLVKQQWQFDLVLLPDIFSTLRYPMLAKDIVARVTKGKIILHSGISEFSDSSPLRSIFVSSGFQCMESPNPHLIIFDKDEYKKPQREGLSQSAILLAMGASRRTEQQGGSVMGYIS